MLITVLALLCVMVRSSCLEQVQVWTGRCHWDTLQGIQGVKLQQERLVLVMDGWLDWGG